MKRWLSIVLLITGCNSTKATDADSGAQYPSCSAPSQQCMERIAVGDRQLPIYRNVALDAPNANITQAVIVVHGADRDANNYFYSVMTAASELGLDQTTAIIAPHFQCAADSPPAGDAYWQCSGADWSHGYADASGAATPIYSYAVMDQLVAALADKTILPNLTRIVVTGLSAGGQFTQRYAATNALDPISGSVIDYVPLSPSSYLYLDPGRPASTAGCPGFDDYHYGLENRSGYVARPGAATIQTQLVARSVAYFVGSEDTLANAAGTDLDTSCAANAQGIDRVARANDFWNVIRQSYGSQQPLTIVPGCMHSRSCMYLSPQVRLAVFGAETMTDPERAGER